MLRFSIAVAIGRVLVSDSPFQREKRQKVPNVLKAEQIMKIVWRLRVALVTYGAANTWSSAFSEGAKK